MEWCIAFWVCMNAHSAKQRVTANICQHDNSAFNFIIRIWWSNSNPFDSFSRIKMFLFQKRCIWFDPNEMNFIEINYT